MKKMLVRFAAIATLALGASIASAIPLTVSVTTSTGGSAGSWTLSGPTDDFGIWVHPAIFAPSTSTWNLNILAGLYNWELDGTTGFASPTDVSWSFSLNGSVVDSGDFSTKRRLYKFGDDGSFTAVPEPATLALLGLGLAGLGFARRRKA